MSGRDREMNIIHLMQRFFVVNDGKVRGLDDDGAIIPVTGRPDDSIIVSVDAQTGGRDFVLSDDPFLIGRYCAAASASDIAAMGAEPRYLLIDLLLPFSLDDQFFRSLAEGLRNLADRCGAAIIGGDTEDSASFARISVTAIGYCAGWQPLTRGGARPGDVLCLVGRMGRPLAKCVLDDFQLSTGAFLEDVGFAHVGSLLGRSRIANAAMDTSDGLYIAIRTMCEAGGVGCLVDIGKVPLAVEARSAVDAGLLTAEQIVTSDLSDHLLAIALPRESVGTLRRILHNADTPVAEIGVFTSRRDLLLEEDGRRIDAAGIIGVQLHDV
jgi:thiamine-monophosphate kinase